MSGTIHGLLAWFEIKPALGSREIIFFHILWADLQQLLRCASQTKIWQNYGKWPKKGGWARQH